jgi:hypothetical protein
MNEVNVDVYFLKILLFYDRRFANAAIFIVTCNLMTWHYVFVFFRNQQPVSSYAVETHTQYFNILLPPSPQLSILLCYSRN